MKQAIHPDYHPVVFRDRAANFAFLTRSTASSERTITWGDGNTYPVVDVGIPSASHRFYTGQERVPDPPGGEAAGAGLAGRNVTRRPVSRSPRAQGRGRLQHLGSFVQPAGRDE